MQSESSVRGVNVQTFRASTSQKPEKTNTVQTGITKNSSAPANGAHLLRSQHDDVSVLFLVSSASRRSTQSRFEIVRFVTSSSSDTSRGKLASDAASSKLRTGLYDVIRYTSLLAGRTCGVTSVRGRRLDPFLRMEGGMVEQRDAAEAKGRSPEFDRPYCRVCDVWYPGRPFCRETPCDVITERKQSTAVCCYC